jgi:hypothetical protein
MNIDELYETIVHILAFKAMTIHRDAVRWNVYTGLGIPHENYVLSIHCYNFDCYTIYRTYKGKTDIPRLL